MRCSSVSIKKEDDVEEKSQNDGTVTIQLISFCPSYLNLCKKPVILNTLVTMTLVLDIEKSKN